METIKKQLRDLKLAGMVNSLEVRNEYAIRNKLSYLEFLQTLLEDEFNNRRDNSLKKRLIKAKFPVIKKLEDFDFKFQPSINEKEIYDLATCSFVRKKENVVFVGQTGTGKTHLAIGLGFKAILSGYKVLYTSVDDMIAQMNISKADSTYYQRVRYYIEPELLIIDEFGFKKLNQNCVENFFDIISKRYEKDSIIITSNKTFEEWEEVFPDKVLTSAILDRIIHHCHLIQIRGESYRMKEQRIMKQRKRNEKE
jgi:DNA replication protein DnaC